MTPPSKRNAPKAPKGEKLPWEKLYEECTEREVNYEPDEWEDDERMEKDILERSLPDAPSPPPMPISLELLASTAAALRPLFGANGTTNEEVTKKNKRAVAHAYDLLRECGSLLSSVEFVVTRRSALKTRQRERRELDKKSLKIKLSGAVRTITGGYTGNHAPRYFRMFLEVFYGEVLAEEMHGTLRLCRPPFPSGFYENGEWKQRKEGNYKQWATWTYNRYQVHGLREDEVTYLTGKFTELAKEGYLGKSTQDRFSPTKAKDPKTKG